ncbi:MAG: hypothetical protein H6981_00275 [Gammaproteobacteria bacterium]|nr:hypothetical protein [Gammaproteobacteria bacterium]
MSKKTPMTKKAAARIEKANAPKNNGQTPKESFESRAKRAAQKNSDAKESNNA